MDQTEVKYKSKINAKEIFRRIASNPTIKELAKIYDFYLFYSKYDHFSAMYFGSNKYESRKRSLFETCIEIFINHQAQIYLGYLINGQMMISSKNSLTFQLSM